MLCCVVIVSMLEIGSCLAIKKLGLRLKQGGTVEMLLGVGVNVHVCYGSEFLLGVARCG